MEIHIEVTEATTLVERTKGLIGQETFTPLLIKTRFGIHTFGMKVPIDVLILNTNNNVVAYREKLKPNRIYLWNPRYDTVLELPPGTIENKNIKTGTRILLKKV